MLAALDDKTESKYCVKTLVSLQKLYFRLFRVFAMFLLYLVDSQGNRCGLLVPQLKLMLTLHVLYT